MKAYFAEFIGTFLFIFIGTVALLLFPESHLIPALAFGGSYMIVIFFFGRISGAHCNPALSLAAYHARMFHSHELLPYWIVQCMGGIGGVFAASFFFPLSSLLGAPIATHIALWAVFLLECGFIALFCVLVLLSQRYCVRYTSFIAGLSLFLAYLVLLPLTGAALNPVRAIAPVIVSPHHSTIAYVWVYVLAGFVGGGIGGLVLLYVFPLKETDS